jgi:MtN3 and saliva related transmembrane protein
MKILKEKDATGVSLRMFAVTVTAFTLWTAYGVLSQSWPVAASNAVCLALALTIVILRLHFGDQSNSSSPSAKSAGAAS